MFCWSIGPDQKKNSKKTLRLCDFSIAPSLAKAYFSDPHSDDVGVVPWLQFPIIPATGGGIVCLVTFRWFWTLNPTTTTTTTTTTCFSRPKRGAWVGGTFLLSFRGLGKLRESSQTLKLEIRGNPFQNAHGVEVGFRKKSSTQKLPEKCNFKSFFATTSGSSPSN